MCSSDLEELARSFVVCATLHCDAALSDHRDEAIQVEILGDAGSEPQHFERGRSHHDRPSRGHLFEPSGDVATKIGEGEVGTNGAKLRLAPNGSRCNRRSVWKFVERCTNQHVARITPFTPCADDEPGSLCGGKVLAEWMARSACPSRTACWTSLTNTP